MGEEMPQEREGNPAWPMDPVPLGDMEAQQDLGETMKS